MRNGFVLPVALILLLALTLVATGALRASGQESHLAGNAVEKAEAFEASESVRRLFEPLLHAALEGDAAALQAASTSGWTFAEPTSASLATNDDEAGNCATPFVKTDGTPCTLRVDATYERNIAAPGKAPAFLRGQVAVFRMRLTPAPTTTVVVIGSDGSTTATTSPTANQPAETYFYVESRGESDGAGKERTRVVTAAIVRHVAASHGAAAPGGNGEIDWRERRP